MKKSRTDIFRVALMLAASILLVFCLYQLTRTLMGWVLLAILAASMTFLVNIYPRWRKSEAYRALRMADVDDMSGEQFERYVSELLNKQGYKTARADARNDYGVDIVAERDGVRYAVQCRRNSEDISRSAVSDAVAGKHYYKCGRAMVVTNRYFRSGVRELADSSQCELIDRDALAGWIQSFQTAQTPATITSEKARSLAIWVMVGSSACLISLFVVEMTRPAQQTVARPNLERKFLQEKLIEEMIRSGATSEQIAEYRRRLEAMSDAEFQAVLARKKLIEEESRRIERGQDESQKPAEQRGQSGSSGERRTK
jgi:restriction system protein